MKPLNDWNPTNAATGSAKPKKLTAGGHIVEILKAVESANSNGLPALDIYFDIKEGSEYDKNFMSLYEHQKRFNADAKYKGIYHQGMTDEQGNTNPFFKGLITCVEESNAGYKWTWDEKTLKGKKLGIIFREEEYSFNGYTGTSVKPFRVCKAQDALAQPVPAMKKRPESVAVASSIAVAAMEEANDTELPF